jgi:hypothetical protein
MAVAENHEYIHKIDVSRIIFDLSELLPTPTIQPVWREDQLIQVLSISLQKIFKGGV